MRLAALAAILGYQLTVSRLMPSACRYEPSCSRYGFGAVWAHGFLRGGLLTALRLLRCSPIGPGGYDPVPRPEGSPRPR
ncbi:MAG: membrane protein insertion efficiency factor YidD [Planctomycetota bacterium]|nr:MAG: membrane protein insertion efficiency factor YidD [Planctomycetota bacterium]